MFVYKKKYFFIVEDIKKINLDIIKNFNKFNIIYRTEKIKDKKVDLLKFRNICKRKRIGFYVANHIKLMRQLKADGIYISAYNKSLKYKYLKNLNYKIIGSAHNLNEIKLKELQGCSNILFSRLFKTNYNNKRGFLGLIKFNLFPYNNVLTPLGGINKSNFNNLKNLRCNSFAVSSAFIKDNTISNFFY